MRVITTTTSASSVRRLTRTAHRGTRRRPAVLATGIAIAVVAATSLSLTTPLSQASASGTAAAFTVASAPVANTIAPVASPTGSDAIAIAAQDALSQAHTAMDAAATLTADIQSSGLEIESSDSSVDTTALRVATTRLARADSLPAPLVPALTDDVTELLPRVTSRVTDLRGRLDAAVALKAQQEAAAQAQREAEVAAAQAAASASTAAKPSTPSAGRAPVFAASGTSAGEAQATARSILGGYGWGDDQFSCLVSLWDRESGWNYQAYNSSSGATGIPQALPGSKMASAGADWQTNPATQVSWGLGYIAGRYGAPCGAWAHSESVGWY